MLVINVLHASAVGVGFIPILPATDKIQRKYPAAGRVGINPTPTAEECCKWLSIRGLSGDSDVLNSAILRGMVRLRKYVGGEMIMPCRMELKRMSR